MRMDISIYMLYYVTVSRGDSDSAFIDMPFAVFNKLFRIQCKLKLHSQHINEKKPIPYTQKYCPVDLVNKSNDT